jgi:hypothetical protein
MDVCFGVLADTPEHFLDLLAREMCSRSSSPRRLSIGAGIAVVGVLDKLHFRDQRPVELLYPLAPEIFELRQAPLALPDELGDVYA